MTWHRLMRLLPIALTMTVLIGCGQGGGGGGGGKGGSVEVGIVIPLPQKWVEEAISRIVAWMEDETGIEIEKGEVKIESLGVRKEPNGDTHISDFKITVNYRKTEFTSTPKNISCSADGIPTDEGNQRIKEAVDEIKRKIRVSR